jgi:protein required for attachment to host cells
VLVADASRGLVLSVKRNLGDPEVIKEFEHPESRAKGIELAADDRGRTQPRDKESVRGAAMARPTPPREVEAEKFSRELAEYLRLGLAKNQYRALILVAPPQFLGLLRETIDVQVAKSVKATVAKNFCGERPEAVVASISEIMS